VQLPSRKTQGLVAINIAAVIFGTAALFGKLGVSPFWIVAVRAVFAALTLLGVGLARRRIRRPGMREGGWLAASGLLLAMHWVSFFLSVQLAGVAVATLTFAAFPMFTILIEAAQGRAWPRPAEAAAGGVIIAAVGLLAHMDSAAPGLTAGALAGLFSAVTFAAFGLVSKHLGARLPNISVSFFQNLIVALVLAPFLPFAAPVPGSGAEWLGLFLLGTVTTALMHQLYFFSLQRLSAGVCSGFIALEPVYAILFAALLFAEPLTPRVALSGLLILGASYLLLRRERGVVEIA
jgi:drug/metabolite transporter (DMT)-like permease